MADLNYTIPDDKIEQIANDWIYLYPNTERKLKAGIDPTDVPEGTPISDNNFYEDRYTDNAWVREHVKRWANQQLKRSRRKQAQDSLNTSAEGEIE